MQLLTPLFFYASSADLWLCTISRLEHLRSFPEGIAQCDQHLSSTSHPFSNCTRLYNCQCSEGSNEIVQIHVDFPQTILIKTTVGCLSLKHQAKLVGEET